MLHAGRLAPRLNFRSVACLKVPHFAAQVEQRHRTERPVLIGRQSVEDFSQELASLGVNRGMPMRRARVLCPAARVCEPAPERYAVEYEAVLNTLDTFSPLVEAPGVGRAYLEVYPGDNSQAWGVELIAAIADRLELSVMLGMAANKFVSRVASGSLGVKRVLQVAAGVEAEFLQSYSTAILPLDPETQRRLRLLGITTTGAYAALPARAVLNQFGFAGQRAHQLARGCDTRPLQPRVRQDVETTQAGFDPPLEDHATTVRALQRLLARLMSRLQARGQMCCELRVTLELDNCTHLAQQWTLREPTSSPSHLLLPVERWLAAREFSERLQQITVSVGRLCDEEGKQLDLFQHRGGEDLLRPALDRLLKRYGSGRLYQAVLHEKDSLIPQQRFAWIPLRADGD